MKIELDKKDVLMIARIARKETAKMMLRSEKERWDLIRLDDEARIGE